MSTDLSLDRLTPELSKHPRDTTTTAICSSPSLVKGLGLATYPGMIMLLPFMEASGESSLDHLVHYYYPIMLATVWFPGSL
jgi:hypothetical protein